jgi:hypothetical protein
MTTHLSSRDWEALSAYLDGQLAPNERARLEKRLQGSHDLRTALEELRRTRAVLRSQPRLRAPRSFALTPEMVGRHAARPRPAGGLFPVFRLASALAGVLFVVVLLADLLGAGPAAAPPFQVISQAQTEQFEAQSVPLRGSTTREFEAPAAAEAPAAIEAPPAEDGAGETEAPAAELYAVIDPTDMARMTAEAISGTPGAEATADAQSQAAEAGAALPTATAPPAIPIPTEIDPQTQKLQAPSPYPAEEAAQSRAFDQAAPVPPQSGFWTPLRLAEAALAIFALGTGLAALLMRRSSAR